MLSFSAENVKNTRLRSVDMLRGIAVLLVICRHWNVCDFLGHLGWVGVDLFFVLSGFLISGLLFSETEKHRQFDPLRFFVRRGFKIYPLFYTLIAITVIVIYANTGQCLWKLALAECLFVQNYFTGLYWHTWSLAIEEHFYVILLLCFLLLIKKGTLNRIQTLYGILALMASVFCLRIFLCYINQPAIYFFTHTRLDSLLAGVVISFVWRYRKDWLDVFHTRARYVYLALAIATLSIFGFFEPNNLFTQSIGFSLIYVACSVILVYVLTKKPTSTDRSWPMRALSFAGFYSYAIYLGHFPVLNILGYFGIHETDGWQNIAYFILYVLCCVFTGMFFSELIEQPLLRLRNRLYPSAA